MPWEETDEYIRSGHKSPDYFEAGSLRTIMLSEEEGIKVVVGKLKGEDTTTIQSYLFDKSKGWMLDKAKAWFEAHQPVREHAYAVLPFQVLEKVVDKPLRIRGVAMTSGMSRNFNIYTSEELQAFASKLVGAPVYVEHVSVDNAVGKVTKTDWDGRALWYEAEIYESDVADKIRKGLVQHVSVGANYETLDVVDGKIPHGLHNAELSLVAVPGIPETNIQVLERLRESFKGPLKEHLKEQGDVVCAFCGAPADYIVSICQSCFDKISPAGAATSASTQKGSESLEKEEFKQLVKEALKEAGVAEAEWDTEYINNLPDDAFAYIEPGGEKDEQGKTKPRSLRHLPYKNAQGNLDADHVRNALARLDQTNLSAEAKREALRKLCAAAGELGIASEVCNLKGEAEQLKAKLIKAENRIAELQKQLPGGGLLKDPPRTMPAAETIQILEGLLLSPTVEHSTPGEQRHHQQIRREIWKLKERL